MDNQTLNEVKNKIVQSAIAYHRAREKERLIPHPRLENELNNLTNAIQEYETLLIQKNNR